MDAELEAIGLIVDEKDLQHQSFERNAMHEMKAAAIVLKRHHLEGEFADELAHLKGGDLQNASFGIAGAGHAKL